MQLEQLLERFKKKDIKAFESLHGMYSANIYGVINIIIKDDALSQEICQDVFIKVWNNAESYNASKGRFFTWILNIARNTAIDEVRSKSFKKLKKNLSINYFVGIEEQTNEIEKSIDIVRLKKLIKNLKDKCVQIIDLLYFKGYSQKEVSEELNIPIGTVKTRNRSCISQLRKNITL